MRRIAKRQGQNVTATATGSIFFLVRFKFVFIKFIQIFAQLIRRKSTSYLVTHQLSLH